MSADPTPPPPPEPVPPATGETPVETLPQKRRYKRTEPAEVPATEGDSDNEIIVLSSLLQNLLARKQGTEGTETTESETRGKINRFVSRKDAPPVPADPPRELPPAAVTVPPPVQAPPPPAVPARSGGAGLEGMNAIAFPKFEPRGFQPEPSNTWWDRSGSTWGRGVLYFSFSAGLALLAFLAGRSNLPRAAALPNKTPANRSNAPWTPTVTEQLGRALTADQAGDLNAARQIAINLQQSLVNNPFLEGYLATLDTRSGRLNDVEASIARRINPGIPPDLAVALLNAQAFNYCRRREFERAIDCFGEIAKIQPSDARNFLHWGEALRRLGRLSEAITKFQETILRLPEAVPSLADDREYAAFKRRLSQVEFGRPEDLRAELDQRLGAPVPGGYWLLTGAAVALQAGDVPGAVELLKKAQAVYPPQQFTTLLEDYFFRAQAYHPEISVFLTPSSPEKFQERQLRMNHFVDP